MQRYNEVNTNIEINIDETEPPLLQKESNSISEYMESLSPQTLSKSEKDRESLQSNDSDRLSNGLNDSNNLRNGFIRLKTMAYICHSPGYKPSFWMYNC